jgi:hypothetical protein
VLTRQEKEKLVIDLYNQGMTIRDIAKELRISFRDIGVILKRASGEIEEKQEKETASLSPSAQAYRLFSEGKPPIEVAIALNLDEFETRRLYEEYLDLMQMHDLKNVHDVHFLQLHRLSKKERMNPQRIVSLLKIANNDLPELERRYHRLKRDIVLLEIEKQKSEQIGSQVRILAKMSEDYRQQIKELHKKKIELENLLRKFENNDSYKKIKKTVGEEVNNTLSNSMNLLKLALASILEATSQDQDKYNFLVNSNQRYGKYAASNPFIEAYRNLILDEAMKLFELMKRDLTSRIIN